MLSEEELDHVCWLLSTSEDRQKEIAEERREEGEERALYHGGSYDTYKEIREFLEQYDVDVVGRARSFADRKGVNGPSTAD